MNKKVLIGSMLLLFVGTFLFAESLACYDGGKIEVGFWGQSVTATSTSPKKQNFSVIVLFKDGTQSTIKTFTVDAATVDKNGKVTSTGYNTYPMGKDIERLVKCTL